VEVEQLVEAGPVDMDAKIAELIAYSEGRLENQDSLDGQDSLEEYPMKDACEFPMAWSTKGIGTRSLGQFP